MKLTVYQAIGVTDISIVLIIKCLIGEISRSTNDLQIVVTAALSWRVLPLYADRGFCPRI